MADDTDPNIKGYFPPKPIDPPWRTTAEAGQSKDSIRQFKRPVGPEKKKLDPEDENWDEGN